LIFWGDAYPRVSPAAIAYLTPIGVIFSMKNISGVRNINKKFFLAVKNPEKFTARIFLRCIYNRLPRVSPATIHILPLGVSKLPTSFIIKTSPTSPTIP